MVDEELVLMYDQVIDYLRLKQGYYEDPTASDAEFNDYLDQDLTETIATIQFQVRRGANIGEAATIKAYRDMRASSAEYGMRRMSRSNYWSDAALEETDNIDKWVYNKVLTNHRISGRDSGS